MRSGYSDDGDYIALWRGAVQSAINGKRGQAFLKEMLVALDAMPEKRLIAEELQRGTDVCALGCVGKARGVDMIGIQPNDHERLAKMFRVAPALIQEIEYMNDDEDFYDFNTHRETTPEKRFATVRAWVAKNIRTQPA